LQKNKDFPVKILETEEKNDNLTDRDRSSTPYKKTKNNIEANYLYERFMRNKKNDKGKDKSKSYKQNRKKIIKIMIVLKQLSIVGLNQKIIEN